MFCQNCGRENKIESVFCEACGERLETDEKPEKEYEPSDGKRSRVPNKAYIAVGIIALCIVVIVGGFTAHKIMSKETYYLIGNLSLDKSAYAYSAAGGNYFNGLDDDSSYGDLDSWLTEHIVNDSKPPEGMNKDDWDSLKTEIVYSSDDFFAEDDTSVDRSICKNGDKINIKCSFRDPGENSVVSNIEKKYNCKIALSRDSENEGNCTESIAMNGWPKNYETVEELAKEKRNVLEKLKRVVKDGLEADYSKKENLELTSPKLYYLTAEKNPLKEEAIVVCAYKVRYTELGKTHTEYAAYTAGHFTEAFNESDLETEVYGIYGIIWAIQKYEEPWESEKTMLQDLDDSCPNDIPYKCEKINL